MHVFGEVTWHDIQYDHNCSLLLITMVIEAPATSKIRTTMMKIEAPISPATSASEPLRVFPDLDIVGVTAVVADSGDDEDTWTLLVADINDGEHTCGLPIIELQTIVAAVVVVHVHVGMEIFSAKVADSVVQTISVPVRELS